MRRSVLGFRGCGGWRSLALGAALLALTAGGGGCSSGSDGQGHGHAGSGGNDGGSGNSAGDGGGGNSGGGSGRETIGEEGGSVTSEDGRVTLEIPESALDEPTEITIERIEASALGGEFDEIVAGLGEPMAYELGPDGLAFENPITVRIASEQKLLDDATLRLPLGLVFSSDGESPFALDNLRVEPDESSGNARVSSELDHFSPLVDYADQLGGAILFEVNGVPGELEVGESFVAQATVSGPIADDSALRVTAPVMYEDRSTSPVVPTFSPTSAELDETGNSVFQEAFEYTCTEEGSDLYAVELTAGVRIALDSGDIVTAGTWSNLHQLVECVSTAPPAALNVEVTKFGDGEGTAVSEPDGVDCGPECDQQGAVFDAGTEITLTATPEPGSEFIGWDGNGSAADCGENPVCTFTLEENSAATAEFQPGDDEPQGEVEAAYLYVEDDVTYAVALYDGMDDPRLLAQGIWGAQLSADATHVFYAGNDIAVQSLQDPSKFAIVSGTTNADSGTLSGSANGSRTVWRTLSDALYAAPSDGSEQRLVTEAVVPSSGARTDRFYQPSADGSYVAWLEDRSPLGPALKTLNLADPESVANVITENIAQSAGVNFRIDLYRRDGATQTRIVYVTEEETGEALRSSRLDGTDEIVLARANTIDFKLWERGDAVVVAALKDDSDIVITPLDAPEGDAQQRVLSDWTGRTDLVRPSPDGAKLIYPVAGPRIRVVDTATGDTLGESDMTVSGVRWISPEEFVIVAAVEAAQQALYLALVDLALQVNHLFSPATSTADVFFDEYSPFALSPSCLLLIQTDDTQRTLHAVDKTGMPCAGDDSQVPNSEGVRKVIPSLGKQETDAEAFLSRTVPNATDPEQSSTELRKVQLDEHTWLELGFLLTGDEALLVPPHVYGD